MAKKDKRFCDYKDCGLPENNKAFLVQSLYLLIVFVILIKDIEKVTTLNMILFVAPSAIDVLCFKHQKKIHKVFILAFIVILVVFAFLVLITFGEVLTDNGKMYSIADTFPILGHRTIPKEVLLYLTASMIGVPLFMYFARPNKEQARTLALREKAIQGE